MINEMRDFVLELVQSEYETGHVLASDRNEFNDLCRDEGYRATKDMYDLYEECHNLGPAGFYAEYKDELDFDPDFVAEYDDHEVESEELSDGDDYRWAPYTDPDGPGFYSDEEDIPLDESFSNKEKLKRAYPDLNFDTSAAETLTEAVNAEDKMQTAVGILYDMDNFVLSVYDNDYWLSMGVPDGEFDETDRDIAEANYKDHEWLIEGDEEGSFDREAFKDLLDAFQVATHGKDYDQNERARIIHEAETILSMNESWEEDEYETSERYFIYDENDQCVSNDYSTLSTAAKKAQEADYPVVKIHRYFRDENGKLQPDGDPEIVWTSGDPITESYDKDGNHEKCEECGALLNDAGECPRCVHGDEEASEQLNEEVLTEGPFNSIKRQMARADSKRNSETDKLANPKNIGNILFNTYKDDGNSYLIDGKLMKSRDVLPDLKKSIEYLYEIDKPLTTISKDKLDPDLIKFIDAVVIDRNGYIIRRGLELIKPKTVEYNPNRLDALRIKNGFKSDDIIGRRPLDKTSDTETADKSGSADSSSSAEPADSSSSDTEKDAGKSDSEATETAKGVTDKTIQNTIKAAKVFGMNIYIKKNDRLRMISDNQLKELKGGIDPTKIWIGKDNKTNVTLAQLANELKGRNIVESLDDEMEYDNLEEKVITHDSLQDGDMEELLSLAKEIGINTVGELNQFAEREVPQGTSLLDTLKQYRDDLGDDFEIVEDFDNSPEVPEEGLNDEFDDPSKVWY